MVKGKKYLTKKLDSAWSKVILSKGKCEVCGKRENLNPHHYISRSNRRLRWDIRNGICCCVGCHLFKNESFHKNPEWGHFWMEDKRWEDLAYINVVMYEIKKWTVEDMESKLKELGDEVAYRS